MSAIVLVLLVLSGCGGGGSSSTGDRGGGEITTVADEGGGGIQNCPPAEELQTQLELPITWTLRQTKRPSNASEYSTGAIKAAYKRYCVYSGSDHNSYLYLIFAQYPEQAAKERFAAMQQQAQSCREPSLCHQVGAPEETSLVDGEGSYVAYNLIEPGTYEGDPWLAEMEAGAEAGDGILCQLPVDLPQRLGAQSEVEVIAAYTGLQRFVRAACGLSAESEEPGQSEPVEAGDEEGGSGGGSAEETYVAYTRDLDEADYEAACELVVSKYKEKLPEPCPQFLDNKVFKGLEATPQQLKETEAQAAEATELKIEEGELLEVGGEWLVNPEAVEEGLNE